jgi:hypothetical protein
MGKELPGDQSCRFCKDLLTNADSLAAILKSDPPYQYPRSYSSLQDTAEDGCVLCLILLDRQEQYGPLISDDDDIIDFTVHKFNEADHPSSGLRSLLFEGPKRNGGLWNLPLHVCTDEGTILLYPITLE